MAKFSSRQVEKGLNYFMTYKKIIIWGFCVIFMLKHFMQYHFLFYQTFIIFFSPSNTNSTEEGYFW